MMPTMQPPAEMPFITGDPESDWLLVQLAELAIEIAEGPTRSAPVSASVLPSRAPRPRETSRENLSGREQWNVERQWLRPRVLDRDGPVCALCGHEEREDLSQLHIDHIIPIYQGGTNELANLRVFCAPCNLGRKRK